MTALLLILAAVALLVTKALDVHSTWRYVGVAGELNPLVRRWFVRHGLGRGLVLACAVYLTLLAVQLLAVWWIDEPILTGGTVLLGAFIAWAQWDVARFNRTHRHSWFTRLTSRVYLCWNGLRSRKFSTLDRSSP